MIVNTRQGIIRRYLIEQEAERYNNAVKRKLSDAKQELDALAESRFWEV